MRILTALTAFALSITIGTHASASDATCEQQLADSGLTTIAMVDGQTFLGNFTNATVAKRHAEDHDLHLKGYSLTVNKTHEPSQTASNWSMDNGYSLWLPESC
ncbi:MAG: hypothetical protein ACI9H6_000450 [Patiriisocius sp.]|jgi:hypothetical protein